jgi:hypothetical protein
MSSNRHPPREIRRTGLSRRKVGTAQGFIRYRLQDARNTRGTSERKRDVHHPAVMEARDTPGTPAEQASAVFERARSCRLGQLAAVRRARVLLEARVPARRRMTRSVGRDGGMTMKRPLRVTMYVSEPSDIELRTQETVRIDRMTVNDAGEYDAERHGDLVRPGVTTLQLDVGVYHFRTMSDAALRVVRGGVTALASPNRGKDPPVPPPPRPIANPPAGSGADARAALEAFSVAGDDPPGETPALTIVGG